MRDARSAPADDRGSSGHSYNRRCCVRTFTLRHSMLANNAHHNETFRSDENATRSEDEGAIDRTSIPNQARKIET